MNVDTKHPLLKNSIAEQSLSKKSPKSTIDQSTVTSTEQKALNLELENKKNSPQKNKKKHPESSKKLLPHLNEENEEDEHSLINKIERNPIKLLQVI